MANTNPDISAGTEITADLLNSMMHRFKYKSADTSRASTTTLVDDPDLTLTLDANSVYHVEFYIFYAAITAAHLKTGWTVPSGATGNRSATGLDSTVAAFAGICRSGVHNYTTTVNYGDRNDATLQCLALETAIVTTTNAGTCALQWAQSASSATAIKVAGGSYMRVHKLA